MPNKAIWINADCLKLNRVINGPKFDCIVADPPYNIGMNYAKHNDHKTEEEYYDWLKTRLRWFMSVLKPNGTMWFIATPKICSTIWYWLEKNKIGKIYQQIIWHYNFGQHTRSKFIPCYTPILWVIPCGCSSPDFYLNSSILEKSYRLKKYKDKRITSSELKGWRVLQNVWTIPRVTGNSSQRVAYVPNQLPETLVERLVLSVTKDKGWVFDPFCGTSTVAYICQKQGINVLSTDIDKQCIVLGKERIAKLTG